MSLGKPQAQLKDVSIPFAVKDERYDNCEKNPSIIRVVTAAASDEILPEVVDRVEVSIQGLPDAPQLNSTQFAKLKAAKDLPTVVNSYYQIPEK